MLYEIGVWMAFGIVYKLLEDVSIEHEESDYFSVFKVVVWPLLLIFKVQSDISGMIKKTINQKFK